MPKSLVSIIYSIGVAMTLAGGSAMAQDPWAESYQLESEGSFDAAAQALAPIIQVDSAHEFAVLRTAWLKYLDGDYNAAIRDYRLALEINDQSFDARLGLILPLLAQQRWREAAASAEEVMKTAPWNYYAHIRLMVAEEGMRQWQTLARHAKDVATRYPGDATVLVYLARAEARQGNTDIARGIYTEVMERVPEHAEAMSFIAANDRRSPR